MLKFPEQALIVQFPNQLSTTFAASAPLRFCISKGSRYECYVFISRLPHARISYGMISLIYMHLSSSKTRIPLRMVIWVPVVPIHFRFSSVVIFLHWSSLRGIIIRKSALILGVYFLKGFISGCDASSTASDNCEIPFSQIRKVLRRHLVGIASTRMLLLVLNSCV